MDKKIEGRGGYTPEQCNHLMEVYSSLRQSENKIFTDLVGMSYSLKEDRARTYSNEGVGRRFGVVSHSLKNIFKIYPPNRVKHLSKDECADIDINLHAFSINLYAILDNIAWVVILESKVELQKEKIGPYRKECKKFLPKELGEYFQSDLMLNWISKYGKNYRDSIAHRIPLYLPPRVYTNEETEMYKKLDDESWSLVLNDEAGNGKFERIDQLRKERDSLGRNSLFMTLTGQGIDASKPVFMHQQLLSDWGLCQELVSIFTKSMRDHFKLV